MNLQDSGLQGKEEHTSVHQNPHTSLCKNTLLHGEALLVTASHNLEYITLELLQKTANISKGAKL
jgi:hypothetical protein